tara:strand:+ start:167 stop:358 length:192 start_codon:yes stop_codon:yes gene_type:complete
MNPLRYARTSIHKKSETVYVGRGKPKLKDLKEGVPVIRTTSSGVSQYIKIKNVLWKLDFTRDS